MCSRRFAPWSRAGLRPHQAACWPRLHDIRHRFAVCTLLDAHQQGQNPGVRIALLATYLGHVDPKYTYWYLSAAPELMQLATGRLERHLGASARAPSLPRSRRSSPTGSFSSATPARTPSLPTATRGGCSSALPRSTSPRRPRKLELGDLHAPFIGRFLAYLEHDRENTVRHSQRTVVAVPGCDPARPTGGRAVRQRAPRSRRSGSSTR